MAGFQFFHHKGRRIGARNLVRLLAALRTSTLAMRVFSRVGQHRGSHEGPVQVADFELGLHARLVYQQTSQKRPHEHVLIEKPAFLTLSPAPTTEIFSRASSRWGKHEGESSFGLCDRLSRTRDNSQRQLPTDQDYAVPTREYQTDQSSLKTAPTAARSVLEQRRKQ
jgi:hypothetical protein